MDTKSAKFFRLRRMIKFDHESAIFFRVLETGKFFTGKIGQLVKTIKFMQNIGKIKRSLRLQNILTGKYYPGKN